MLLVTAQQARTAATGRTDLTGVNLFIAEHRKLPYNK